VQSIEVVQVLAAVKQIGQLADVVLTLDGARQSVAADRRRRKRRREELRDLRQTWQLTWGQSEPVGQAGGGRDQVAIGVSIRSGYSRGVCVIFLIIIGNVLCDVKWWIFALYLAQPTSLITAQQF